MKDQIIRIEDQTMRRRAIRRRLPRWAMLGLVLAATLVAGCSAASGTGQGQASPAPTETAETAGPGAAAAVQQEFVSVIQRVLPSVVEIRTSAGLGSGVVLDADGDIVTNAHVVGDATSFQVLTASSAGTASAGATQAPLSAVLVGSCPSDDLAVVRVADAAQLRPATFADTASVSVGDIVLAIGSPLGLGGSVTDGIVSAVGRSVAEPASTGAPAAVLSDVIQTSAAINPGNSGGALVSLDGEVIGIPTLAAVNRGAGGGAGGAAPGIGFAIPASTAVHVAGQLTDAGGSGAVGLPAGCHR
jgi:putative serine protease PepD